jgi:HK97 family phage major capsid protein
MFDFTEMTIESLEERKAELVASLDNEGADLDAIEEEVRAIKTEMETRKQAEAKKNEVRSLVASGEGEVIKKAESEERGMKDIKEFRNSKEYMDLFAEYIKTGKDEELRGALLTTNAENGTIAVPDMVYDIVKTAWDRNEIMGLVTKTEVKGNLKVNFEISGGEATIHTDGSGAVDEEELVEGIVTIVPAFVKKWKSFSDEVMAMRGEAFIQYIYDELAYRIIKKMADALVGQIAGLPQTATATSVSANKITSAPAVGTVAEALGQLSDEATNPVVVMNKASWSKFKAQQYANGYSVDPFEGFEVHFNNSLPAYDTATAGQVYAIVGDFGEGTIANFPNGEEIQYTFDELSRKKEDLVEVLGKVYVGLGVVADKSFTLIAKPETV